LIPVLDVMGGQVVRAVGGRREQYQPLTSQLTTNTAPEEVLSALVTATGAAEVDIADLDAITGSGEISRALSKLIECNHTPVFWIDAGLRSRKSYLSIPWLPHVWPVIASETAGPAETAEIILSMGKDDPFAFSIDLRDGQVLCNWKSWGLADARDAIGLARCVVDMGVRTLIVLDVARVGIGAGTGTNELLKEVRAEFADVELIVGGGVKTWADIDRLGKAGADAVLVASALHEGTITLPRPVS
jgi:phosphoribosylformimino-5-aminoimidazole carboxamide ribotide isomerase